MKKLKKKVLMLGGSHFQTPSIITAVKLGYYTISCDYLPNNPGHKFAHEYHNVSTTDKEGVLKLAKKLKIDGIVCYASDPAAETAAYVAEKMGLPGNPYSSVKILTNKDKFREFLVKHNFNVPKAQGFSSYEKAIVKFNKFKMPVMVKPTDSSGSKGVSRIFKKGELKKAVEYALSYSRCKRFIIEEFVEKFGYQIAGDGFSVNGELVFRCFANEHFDDKSSNPFVPIGESWPYNMPKDIHNKVHNEIQRLITLLKMKTSAYNFDIRIDKNKNVYLMEVGPRNGGNLIPQVIKYLTGIDLVEHTIKAAVGEDCSDLKMVEPKGFWSCFMVHSEKEGILKQVYIDKNFKARNIVEFEMFYKVGEKIPSFKGSNGTLGTMILKFDSEKEMHEKMNNMQRWVKIILK
ncbi:MAG: ATP-grasp domain-containing protein [Microgenomates group bacterium]|nr:ATP-grasp domain-containing protein [Microgenomates group bacterium]